MDEWILKQADRIIRLALEEDLGPTGDLASNGVSRGRAVRGCLIAKATGVLAGLAVFARVFRQLGDSVEFTGLKSDGDKITPGETLLQFNGLASILLPGERTALNLLQRLSGIATATAAMVERLAGTGVRLLDTRKTAPGMRALDKYAVRIGGGANHRMGLFDLCMLKDNHVDLAGGVAIAIREARETLGIAVKIEVEVRTPGEARDAADAGADIVMLDNMTPDQARDAVRVIAGRSKVEISGGITLETIRDYALPGVDYISCGALTHSVKALDLSMKFDRG